MKTQLDRIEDRLDAIDDRTRAMEIRLAKMDGEKLGEGRAARMIKHAVTAAIAAIAGLAGGNLPIPGGH